MKKCVTFAILVVALLSGWLAYSKVTQAWRDAAYRAAMAPFQRDLRVGTSRADAEGYLHSHGVEYHATNFGETHLMQIGEEPPGNLWCEPSRVSIALEFGSGDTLTEVQIRKIGTCL